MTQLKWDNGQQNFVTSLWQNNSKKFSPGKNGLNGSKVTKHSRVQNLWPLHSKRSKKNWEDIESYFGSSGETVPDGMMNLILIWEAYHWYSMQMRCRYKFTAESFSWHILHHNQCRKPWKLRSLNIYFILIKLIKTFYKYWNKA